MKPWSLLLATVLAFVPVVWGGHLFVPDDVYFYLKIASEIVEGNGSTFNGLLQTNGYHPLWMLVCVLERASVGPDPNALIRLHLAVSGLFNLLSILLGHRLARHLGFEGVVTGAAIGFYLSYNPLGSEIHVAAPLVLLAAILLVEGEPHANRALARMGGVLGLAMLGRLDNVFVAGAMALCAILGGAPRDLGSLLRKGLAVGVPAASVVAPYLAWNWLSFGHLVPISGAIKSGLAADTLLPRLGSQATLLMLCTPLSLGVAWLSPLGMRRSTWVALACGALLHSGYVLLRMENVWTWYFTSELVAAALLAEANASWIARGWRRSARWLDPALRVAMVFPLLFVAGSNLMALRQGPPWFFEMARWLDENLPPGAAVAATCSPGGIGYFSQRPVFALDGLTGDFAFHGRAASRGLARALHELGVEYVYSFGPRSDEVTHYARETERRGHGGEAVAFYATPLASGESELVAIDVLSPILGRRLGRICLGPERLVGEVSLGRRMGVWKVAPDGGCVGERG